jgi:hypothetical protein
VVRNGDVNGFPGCVNLSFSYVEGESLLMALKVQTLNSLSLMVIFIHIFFKNRILLCPRAALVHLLH